MQSNDRTYQFISDPTHKENLSGRVSAACLHCRKKKIKCSGEENCKQCHEKGLVCEGPPSRKRSRRDNASPSNTSRSVASTNSHTNSSETTASEQRRPSFPLVHEDSGYSSLRRPSPAIQSPNFSKASEQGEPLYGSNPAARNTQSLQGGHSAPPSRANSIVSPTVAQFTFSADYNTQWDSNQSTSPDALPTEWGFAQPGRGSQPNAYPHSSAFTSTQSNSSRGQSVPDSRRTMAIRTPGIPAASQTPSIWPQQNAHMPQSDLIDAAIALEEEARTLRHLALREMSHGSFGPPQDQQTLLNTNPPPVDHSQPMQQFNPTTFFRADGTIRDDLTPVMGGQVANWWNVPQNQELSYDHTVDGNVPDPALSINTNQLPNDISDNVEDLSPSAVSGKAPGRMQRAFLGQLAPPTSREALEGRKSGSQNDSHVFD